MNGIAERTTQSTFGGFAYFRTNLSEFLTTSVDQTVRLWSPQLRKGDWFTSRTKAGEDGSQVPTRVWGVSEYHNKQLTPFSWPIHRTEILKRYLRQAKTWRTPNATCFRPRTARGKQPSLHRHLLSVWQGTRAVNFGAFWFRQCGPRTCFARQHVRFLCVLGSRGVRWMDICGNR